MVLSAGEEAALLQLLQNLTNTLDTGNQPAELVLKVPDLWLSGKLRLPGDLRVARFCLHLLLQLGQEGIVDLLGAMEGVFARDSPTAALQLAE